ncbi:MAG TPA: pirin family protein [Verrucomicrobiae bacterium]|nr:pirin family protein [Verrucomicrobiae bacterium]
MSPMPPTSPTSQKSREAVQIVTAHHQREGAGFVVRRPFPTLELDQADPFLLIDEMGPADYKPGEAVGAPDHPHRGFETVTYMLAGEFEHEDSAGHHGFIRPGDVQWMTAGGGIVHSEMPSKEIREKGGRVHGFQIWVNLPAKLKMSRPRYQEIAAAGIPTAKSPDGLARVRVVAGEALGAKAVIDTHIPIVYQDWSIDAGADVTIPIPHDLRAMAYVFEGSVRVGDSGTEVGDGQLAVFGEGESVRFRGRAGAKGADANKPARLLLLAGKPIGEPVARYGPFVMNTEGEIRQAIRDYQSGKMGEITRTAELR